MSSDLPPEMSSCDRKLGKQRQKSVRGWKQTLLETIYFWKLHGLEEI